ncbi:MAG: AAA family ATPase [Acidimicrobiales bacterium]
MSAACEPLFVIVSGPPASGKSTLAPQVAAALGLPLIAKDTIKDAIMSVLNVPDVEGSRKIGRASVVAMLAVARESPIGAVIESNFYRSVAGAELAKLPGQVVEVFCRCTADLAWERYCRRAGSRHAGHFDHERTRDELWNDEVAEPVAGPWPLLKVDTSAPVDVATVVELVRSRAHLSEPSGDSAAV